MKESSGFIKQQKRDTDALRESVELLKRQVRKLHAEIEGDLDIHFSCILKVTEVYFSGKSQVRFPRVRFLGILYIY